LSCFFWHWEWSAAIMQAVLKVSYPRNQCSNSWILLGKAT
jgi:hypothetical protein